MLTCKQLCSFWWCQHTGKCHEAALEQRRNRNIELHRKKAQNRSKKNKSRPSKAKRVYVLQRDSYTCYYCLNRFNPEELNVDHKVARSNGGTNDLDNLVASCYPCNAKKGVMSVEEFRGQKEAPA